MTPLSRVRHEFNYRLSELAIEAWHLHWIIFHGEDSPDVMAGHLKNRMRIECDVARGRIGQRDIAAKRSATTSRLMRFENM